MKNALYGSDTEIIKTDDNCTVFPLSSSHGEATGTSYRVFPGMELIYHERQIPSCLFKANPAKGSLEIHHCQEGRMEYEFADGNYTYLACGDLAIEKAGASRSCSHFPFPAFKGISLIIDLEQAPKCLSCILADVPVDLGHLAEKFCNPVPYTILRENPCFEHIFSELYNIPDHIKKGYFKIKVMELLLFLYGLTPENNGEPRRYFKKDQVDKVKAVKRYLVEHIDEHITLQQLSSLFQISQTSLKTCFKSIYGASVYAFIRDYKIQNAARLLQQTNKSILEIAGMVGYDNGSKFAGAFKEIMHVTPRDFRKLAVQTEPNATQ